MADLFLNFKDFQHEHTDDKSTTLRHKKLGHKITLAHNVLSPKNKQALMDMAKSAKNSQTSDQANEAESQDSGYGKVIKMAQGGGTTPADRYLQNPANRAPGDNSDTPPAPAPSQKEVKKTVGDKASGGDNHPTLDPRSWLANGGQIEQAPNGDVPQPFADAAPGNQPGDANQSPSFTDEVGQIIGKYGVKPIVDFAKGVYNEGANAVSGAKQGIEQAYDAAKDVGSGVMKGAGVEMPKEEAPPPALNPQDIPQPAAPAPEPAPQGLAPQATPKPDAMDKSLSSTEKGMNAGYAKEQSGIAGAAEAKGAMGAEQAQAYDQNIQAEQEAKSHYQDTFNALEKERQDHMQDIQNGHIDPNQYWKGGPNGEGGHSKIAAGIGMILAGFNPTNSPNAAVNFLKFQMEQNLKAQESNLSSKQNLLAANLKQFGNLKDASEMTRLMQNDIMVNELNTAAAKAQNPLAKNAALQASGQLQREQAVNSQKFAMQRAMISMANNGGSPGATEKMLGYMRLYAPEQAKEMEQRYVPGVGMGSVPVPQEVRGQIIATKSVNDLMNKSLEFSRLHKGTLRPSELAQAATIQNQLIGTIKQAQHDGVYKPSEAEFLLSQIGGSPASFFANLSSVPKIRELQSIKQQEYNNLLGTYGIKGQQLLMSQSGAQAQGAHPLEGKTAINAQGQRIIMKNGRWVPQ